MAPRTISARRDGQRAIRARQDAHQDIPALTRENVTQKLVVREGGVEPPHPFEYTDLNRARLPIPPLALTPFGAKRTIQAPA